MNRRPALYEPTDAEWQALGARLFGLPEHQPSEDATRPPQTIFHAPRVADVDRKDQQNAKN